MTQLFPPNNATHVSSGSHIASTTPEWHVLALFTDDTLSDLKGVWGPYTNFNIACAALDELRQWPLDGFWDVRRLNKFVAAKAGNTPNSLSPWTWQSQAA